MLYIRVRKVIGLVLVILFSASCFTSEVQSYFSLPTKPRVMVGDHIPLKLDFPKKLLSNLSVSVKAEDKSIIKIDGNPLDKEVFKYINSSPVVTKPGNIDLQLRLFGVIPIRTMKVQVIPEVKLIPGGHSIGILLHSQGVMVVGQSIVNDERGIPINPAKDAGVEIGDIILKINGIKISSDEQVAALINQEGKLGKKILLTLKKKEKTVVKEIKPIFCKETGRYRVGLYVRDSAAGVGTLSFYDPLTRNYGALGHVITDADTNMVIGVGDGKVIGAEINGIQPGAVGNPGEKLGVFVENNNLKGNIEKNTNYGLYGKLNTNISNPHYSKPLPIALVNEIKEGPAEILTVTKGEKIEKYQIKIEKVLPHQQASGKGLVIKVTDKKLLKITGGIIQGMSGSPIIQNNKIIGAVTHVFVNDPTKGYGILIEWMLSETNIENAHIPNKSLTQLQQMRKIV